MVHTVTFYNNGFTVDDGPLRQQDDPANAPFLQSIEKVRTSSSPPTMGLVRPLIIPARDSLLSFFHLFPDCIAQHSMGRRPGASTIHKTPRRTLRSASCPIQIHVTRRVGE